MERVQPFGRKADEQAVLDHRLRACVALLAGLEDQISNAVEAPRFMQITRGGEEHRRVTVVPAAVHSSVVARFMCEVVFFLHRQRVHVGAQADRFSARGAATRDHCDDAGAADPRVMLDAQRRQLLADDAGRAMLLEAELGMRVEIAADRRELILPCANVLDRILHRQFRRAAPRN